VASNSPEPRETESVEKLSENEAVTKHGSIVVRFAEMAEEQAG
jgi:hypothetical protein